MIARFLIIFISLIFVQSASAQNWQGIFYFSKDRTITPPLYQYLIDYYTANIKDIESVRGKTTFSIPKNIKVKAKIRTVVIDGNIVQYIRHPNGKDVVLYELTCDNVLFDFKKKDIKVEKNKTDKDSSLKPSNLTDKVKEKDDKDKKKDNTSVTPGVIDPGNSGKKNK